MTKASIASTSVIHRCRQIVPSANHLYTRPATSPGVEKKNGGSRITPPIGTVDRTCHSASAATATRIWSERSVRRFISASPRLCIPPHHFVLEGIPDFAMQCVEGGIELHLADVARAAERHLPVADDARGRSRRDDDDAVGERDHLLAIVG